MTQENEIDEILRKLKPKMGALTKKLWLWQLTSSGVENRERSIQTLRLLADQRAKLDYQEKIRLPPPRPEITSGKFHFGEVIYPDQVYSELGLTESDLLRHVLVVGMTGSGKTTLVKHLLRQMEVAKIPFLLFDWKQNYREMAGNRQAIRTKLIRLAEENISFRFNPLIPPPGLHPRNWMAILLDTVSHAYFLGQGVEYLLRKAIDQLYQRHGVYEGSRKYPTFIEVEQVMIKEYVKGREMLWMASARRAVASLTFKGILGDILNTQTNSDVINLLNQNVIIELDNLANLEKTFLVESLMLWIYHFKKHLGRQASLNHLTVIEEAHHILSARKERAEGQETIMESSLRMVREFGEGIVVVDQEPSKLSESVIANTATKICFNLGSGKDIAIMAGAMNLTSEQLRYIDRLKIGEAIAKSKTRFPEPLHIRVPYHGPERKS